MMLYVLQFARPKITFMKLNTCMGKKVLSAEKNFLLHSTNLNTMKVRGGHNCNNYGILFLFQNFNAQNPYCNGIQGVLGAYFNAIRSVQLYGPTNFAPCINHVARYCIFSLLYTKDLKLQSIHKFL